MSNVYICYMSKVDFHVRLDSDLLKRLRLYCVEHETGIGEFVEGVIRDRLGSGVRDLRVEKDEYSQE